MKLLCMYNFLIWFCQETSEPRDFSIASSFLFGNEEGMHWGGDCDQSNPTQPCAQQMPNFDSSSRNSSKFPVFSPHILQITMFWYLIKTFVLPTIKNVFQQFGFIDAFSHRKAFLMPQGTRRILFVL